MFLYFLVICTDTPFWKSPEGGEYSGLTCDLLEHQYRWCKNGSIHAGKNDLVGGNPKHNCCACGKGRKPKIYLRHAELISKVDN